METLLRKTAEQLRKQLGERFSKSQIDIQMQYRAPDPDLGFKEKLIWQIYIEGLYTGGGDTLNAACSDFLGKEFIPVEQ